jgi:hypothetical protein
MGSLKMVSGIVVMVASVYLIVIRQERPPPVADWIRPVEPSGSGFWTRVECRLE